MSEPTLDLDRELSTSPTVAGARRGSSLPAHPGVLVGRDDEVGRLDAMLTEKRQRLVAVTGPGAVGKTGVAIAAARRATAAYDKGVRWLAAGSVDSAAGFLGAVAAAIGLPCRARWHSSGSSHSAQLDLMIRELVETELLLVIDQAEQLPDACAEFSRAVVDRTRGINILLTSRQPLRVAGEVGFPISPLAISPLEDDLDRTHSASSALASTGELPDPSTALHHAHFLRDTAERAAEQVTLRGQESGWSTLDRHAVDLRSSLTWFLAHDRRSALRLVAALWRWWQIRGRYTEGRCAVEAALVNSESCPVALRAPVFAGAALLALLQSDYESAQIRAQEALDLYTGLNDSAGVAWSLALIGGIAGERGEYTVAQQLHEQALVLVSRRADARALGTHLNSLALVAWLRGDVNRADHLAHRALDANLQQGNQPEVAWSLINLGAAARYRHETVQAESYLRRSLQLSQEISYREGVAWSLGLLGAVSRLQGEHDRAHAQQSDSMSLHRELGNRWRLASALDELAAGAVARGDAELADEHLAAADRLRLQIGSPVPLVEEPTRLETVATVRSLLAAPRSNAALSEVLSA